MTDLESPKKNNDCYFYYYSTCAKGDSCGFRHEPSALGCETMCSFWKEGKCVNIHCNFRHMELRKNRKAIPCYWETQPVGCLKAHCPFMHQKPKPNSLENISEKSRPDSMLNDQRKVTAVDNLVVSFEEESDNESMPTFSPTKSANRVVTVKTLEDIRIEKIQAESAAFYSCYNDSGEENDLRTRIAYRMRNPDRKVSFQPLDWPKSDSKFRPQKRLNDEQIASILGDDSLRKKQKIVVENGDGNLKILLGRKLSASQVSVTITPESRLVRETCDAKQNVNDIKIKTLAEIRAERQRKDKEEAEVSSTSAGYTLAVDEDLLPEQDEHVKQILNPKKRIKLKRPQQAPSEGSSKTSSDSFERTSLFRKRDDEDDEDLLEDKLLQESDSDDLDVNLNADEDLLLEVDSYSDK